MNKWLEKPWVIRVVALILSVLLFVVVAFDEKFYDNDDGFELSFGTTNETQTLDDVPVQTQIDQEKYVVSGVPETITVSLQGSVSLVTSTVLQRNFDVFVDLEDLGTGTHMVPLEYSGIPDRLNVYIEPQEVEVTIEERASQKFNVTIDTVNRDMVEEGYEVANVYADPEQVEVTSSKNIIDKIAIVKGFVDVSGYSESETIENVPVKVYDGQGNELNVRIDPPTVDVSVDMKNPNKTVPISLQSENEVPEDVRLTSMELETEEVKVFAAESYLDQLEEIETEPIDLSQISESGTIEAPLAISSDVRKINSETVNVNVEVETVEEETVEDVPIEYDDEVDELSVSFSEPDTNSMNITMRGFPSDLSDITVEDLRFTIDIGDLAPGEHELPVELVTPEDIPEGVEFEWEYEQVTVDIEQEE
ncbi:YbbR domain-containing protein [Gracilibacillus orientalis]|uniref:YbbR domain-containing protein n=1 Tax=Gracilibacillus orientalis TaxID=334253 RepID=A0A1I4LI26_9BACI|nr:CdaR family protein [Gracilibacillus orientalis]SFL90237.1 YbbR domain-containing protein [Gracilibacillus orientalis]